MVMMGLGGQARQPVFCGAAPSGRRLDRN